MVANISHGKLEKEKTIVNCAQTMIFKSRRHEKALQVSIFFLESPCYAGTCANKHNHLGTGIYSGVRLRRDTCLRGKKFS